MYSSPFRPVLRNSIAKRLLAFCTLVVLGTPLLANEAPPADTPSTAQVGDAARQQELDAALVEMLSGATLEGSYTSTGPAEDSTKLSREKYMLGAVRKLGGNLWLIPARIQYGEHDVTLPITVPIHWAGDTPVVVVDNVGLPVFGTVSARVMFFSGHYAGYWQHGKKGGHLFGVIRPADKGDDERTGDAPHQQSRPDQDKPEESSDGE